jgi:hypothetical protein
MAKRTQEEINRQIEGLLKMKETLPEYSFFNDNNWKQIDTQVEVLKGDLDADEVEDDDFYSSALDAEDWLNGERDEDLFEV